MFPTTKKALRNHRNLLRTQQARGAIRSGIAFMAVFTACLLAVAADSPAGKPQIQAGNLRIEVDNRLRSRVVARFDKTETVLGPFTASETLTTAGKVWTDFLLTSQRQDRVQDAFGQGTRLTLEGKAGTLTKRVAVTVYDDFPAMALFDVQYTNTGRTGLAVKRWANNAYTMDAQHGGGQPAFWSYQSGSYEKRPNWLLPLHTHFQQENY